MNDKENKLVEEHVCCVCSSTRKEIIINRGKDYEYKIQGDFSLYQCCDCKLISLLPRPPLKSIKDYYPADYHSYHRPSSIVFTQLSKINWLIKKKNTSH